MKTKFLFLTALSGMMVTNAVFAMEPDLAAFDRWSSRQAQQFEVAEDVAEETARESDECIANRLARLRKELPHLKYAEEHDKCVANRLVQLRKELACLEEELREKTRAEQKKSDPLAVYRYLWDRDRRQDPAYVTLHPYPVRLEAAQPIEALKQVCAEKSKEIKLQEEKLSPEWIAAQNKRMREDLTRRIAY